MTTEIKSGRATFRVTGSFLTKHTHDRVQEYGYADAIRFLNSSVPDCPLETAHEIAMGHKQFVGDSKIGLDVVDALPTVAKRIRKILNRKWAGIWYDRPSQWYFRPYATVTSYCQADTISMVIPNRFHGTCDRLVPTELMHSALQNWSLARNVFYMDDKRNDRCTYERNGIFNGAVLWKRIDGEPPFRWPVKSNHSEAFQDYMAAGEKLDIRGGHLDDDEPKRKSIPVTLTVENEEFISDKSVKYPKKLLDLLPTYSEPESNEPPKPTTKPERACYAWLDREGRYWPVTDYYRHLLEAKAIIEAAGVDPLTRDPEKVGDSILEQAGWTKLRWEWKTKPVADHIGEGFFKQTELQEQAVEKWFDYWATRLPRQGVI